MFRQNGAVVSPSRLPAAPAVFLRRQRGGAAQGIACTIVTVFAGDVDEDDMDEFAARMQARWQLGGVDAVLYSRREEDASAACLLGCGLRWLDHTDARDGLYGTDSRLYGLVHEAEAGSRNAWPRSWPACPSPLGIGNHVDHQLVIDAGCALLHAG